MNEHQYLQDEIKDLKKDIADLKADVKELMDIFRASSVILSVIKWLGGVAVGIVSVYLLITGHYK